MKTKKSLRKRESGILVVVPPPPKTELPGAVPVGRLDPHRKHPLDSREHPLARDSRGKPLRTELRKEVRRISGSRQKPRSDIAAGEIARRGAKGQGRAARK